MPAKRKITTEATYEDIKTEPSLRPGRLEEYIGQEKTKENLNETKSSLLEKISKNDKNLARFIKKKKEAAQINIARK